jgi:hypothetical protein
MQYSNGARKIRPQSAKTGTENQLRFNSANQQLN